MRDGSVIAQTIPNFGKGTLQGLIIRNVAPGATVYTDTHSSLQLGALPAVKDQMLNATITARTKLRTVEEFRAIVLKAATDGSFVTVGDVARVALDADNLTVKSRLNNQPGAGLGVVLADGANAMAVATAVNLQSVLTDGESAAG